MKIFNDFSNNIVQTILCLVSQLFLLVSVQCIVKTSHGIKGFSFLQMNEEYLKNIAVIGQGKSRQDVIPGSADIQGISKVASCKFVNIYFNSN